MRLTAASLLAAGVITLAGFPVPPAAAGGHDSEVTVVVDWTRSDAKVNRPIFSTQGFMQVYVQPDPMVMQTFTLLNPRDTQTRLETYIHKMEPENDDDDPWNFNWDKLYPEKMIRFITDRAAFEEVTDKLGMEPLSLLCYSVGWLASDDPDQPINDLDEWAEFAAAVVESYNVDGDEYTPNLRLTQIWNEPDWHFWDGTDEAWFDLYNTAAKRLRENYPGVMVGGPTITSAPGLDSRDDYMRRFLEACGENTDYVIFHHYGPMGEGVKPIADAIKRYAEWFRAIPGKERGRVMITETDAWFSGWEKQQFILERQFRFIDLSDLILGIHHFSSLAYNESGNYTFGTVDRHGGVIEGIYWPYWLFRNWIGEEAYMIRRGPRETDLNLAASFEEQDGSFLATAVMHNRSNEPLPVDTLLYFSAADHDRVLTYSHTTRQGAGVKRADMVPAGADRQRVALELAPGEALALTLQDTGERYFAFRDLNNQETPWIGTASDREVIDFRSQATVTVSVLNTLFEPVSGTIRLAGMPDDWTVEVNPESAEVSNLAFGESHEAVFSVTANSLVPAGRVGVYAVLDQPDVTTRDLDVIPHSIAASMEVRNPLRAQILPLPVKAVPGEDNQVTLQLRNLTNRAIEGTFALEFPRGMEPLEFDTEFRLEPNGLSRFQFHFRVPERIAIGETQGAVTASFLGTDLRNEFTVAVHDRPAATDAVMVDLSEYLNLDAVAFYHDRLNYDRSHMGQFVYPADYTPSGRVVRALGIPYRMASLKEGKNVVRPVGQSIEVPRGNYRGVAFMGYGHDGKHPGTWTFHYNDGTAQPVDSEIPEWCLPPPKGFEEAFTAPYRYIEGGIADPPCQLFVWTIDTDPSKTLTAIELPEFRHGYLFAITLLPE